jgi:hypothetical protein
MIDWQSHMKPQEAEDVAYHRDSAEHHQSMTKMHYREIRKIAERCRQRARKANEKGKR